MEKKRNVEQRRKIPRSPIIGKRGVRFARKERKGGEKAPARKKKKTSKKIRIQHRSYEEGNQLKS